MTRPSPKQSAEKVIAVNRRARHDYFIEERVEAGLVLQGWEAKSLRAGRAQLTESYVQIRNGEAWLIGAHLAPLNTASTHIKADPTRSRKLLLNRNELDRLVGAVERKGFALVPLDLHWHKGRAKLNIGLAKGKKQHDKRAASKDRDWQRQKERILKH
ncbi:SsrA-binding protein SmpB [Gammaproteobacteria bacterium]|jgi:SsrA-binding protein|nr:SsrA-binding protein SmpB [Gammaproteobacteria bacterium]